MKKTPGRNSAELARYWTKHIEQARAYNGGVPAYCILKGLEKNKQRQQVFQLNVRPLTPNMVRYFMDRLAGPVGMVVTPQILRNTFCKRLADADVPLQHLAKMIVVKPEAARVYYAQPVASLEDMLAAAERVAI